eukprot:15478210-Alexandrium_andersonii.AAC.1
MPGAPRPGQPLSGTPGRGRPKQQIQGNRLSTAEGPLRLLACDKHLMAAESHQGALWTIVALHWAPPE